MTEAEVIAACQQLATRRGRELGRPLLCELIDENHPVSRELPESRELLGYWMIIFQGTGFDNEARFHVHDSTGHVTWVNGPAVWWKWLLVLPVLFIWLVTILFVRLIVASWLGVPHYFSVPRCQYCRKKLRTPSAKQCFSCGKSWHEQD